MGHDEPDLARGLRSRTSTLLVKRSGMQSQGRSRIRTWMDAIEFWQLTEKAASQIVQGLCFRKQTYIIRDLWREGAWEISLLLLDFNVALDDL